MKSSLLYILVLSCSQLEAHQLPPKHFRQPHSEAVDNVNPLIGNGGDTPNSSGGMIHSTAPPFAMTRWTAQTRQNYVSMTPYNYTDSHITGFQGTHQPAIWMGESGSFTVVPGGGKVVASRDERGMTFKKSDEVLSASYYRVVMDGLEGGKIIAEQSATSRVGHLRFTFLDTASPYILLESSRLSTLFTATQSAAQSQLALGQSFSHVPFYPEGTITIDPRRREITGSNDERQDHIISPISTPATKWKAYFCARFDTDFESHGVVQNGTVSDGVTKGDGTLLSGYARFSASAKVVNARVGVSFISVDQARKNLDSEVADGKSLEDTARETRSAWAEKLDRIQLEGAAKDEKEIFYTSFFHAMQYPYEQDEDGAYYSGYDDTVHQGDSYTGYSIWDTYRAEWAWLILFAPERVPAMIRSMLQDYKEGGWLPMWKNIIETNIMVGTHADSLIAEAVAKGIEGFDLDLAWEAVLKDAMVPPINDTTVSYFDREQGVDYEVRAGLSTTYATQGWVANDLHSESGSRTLDYAYDDYAISVFASFLNKSSEATFYRDRGTQNPSKSFNNVSGFMEARNANGSWAGDEAGWTEGDKWAYSFDIVQDVDSLIELRGGKIAFVKSLDEHFDGGHNDHSNEPSHHIPYMYSMAGAASKSQERIREITKANYQATPTGLSGNEDCGQMSAWYLFSALGFYPVDPISAEYIVGSPFFDKVTVNLPGAPKPLIITSKGGSSNPYIKSLTVNGKSLTAPIIKHENIAAGGSIIFEMDGKPQSWASKTLSERAEDFYRTLQHVEL